MAPKAHFVKLQYVGEGDKDLRTMLDEVFNISKVVPTRYHTIMDDAVLKLILPKKELLQNFVTPKAKRLFAEKNIQVLETPVTLADRTLYVKYVSDCTWECQDRDADDVLHWMNRKNKIQAESVYLPPEGQQWMKVTLASADDAKRLKKAGIMMRHTIILPSDIKLEEHIEVPQCTRCYSLTHSLAKCNKLKGYKFCSKCGQEGHLYLTCRKSPLHCCNCGGDHSAFSLTCPHKKEAMKACRRARARSSSANRPRQNQGQQGEPLTPQPGPSQRPRSTAVSYAAAAHGPNAGRAPSGQPAGDAYQQPGGNIPHPHIPPQTNPPQVDNKMIYTIYACAAYATFSSDPNAFNKMLVANGMPPVVIPQDLITTPRNSSPPIPSAPAAPSNPPNPPQPTIFPAPHQPTPFTPNTPSTSLTGTPSPPTLLPITPIIPNTPSTSTLCPILSPLPNTPPSTNLATQPTTPDANIQTGLAQGSSSVPHSPVQETGPSTTPAREPKDSKTTPKNAPKQQAQAASQDVSPTSSNSDESLNVVGSDDNDDGYTLVGNKKRSYRIISWRD